MSAVRQHLCNTYRNSKEWLLGDSGYPLEPWLLTPFSNPNNDNYQMFNNAHSKARSTVELSNKRQKTITTANGLQICNKTLEELKSTILTRHTERSTFENKLLAKYDDDSEKAEIFRQNILKMKQEKLYMMKLFLNK